MAVPRSSPLAALSRLCATAAAAAALWVSKARALPSVGCAAVRPRLESGNHTLTVKDPRFGNVTRRFLLRVPSVSSSSSLGTGMPLLLGFHGQSGNPWSWVQDGVQEFPEFCERHGWVAVFPAAFSEGPAGSDADGTDTTWNVGTAADSSTCLPNTTGVQCMASCSLLGLCGRCNWMTCHSDVDFVKQLLDHLEEALCLDSSSYFVFGESNGGMLTHHLIQELPGRFKAAAPVFGSPLLGYLLGSEFQLVTHREPAARTSVIQLHDRSDTVIPWQGGQSKDGWLYETMRRSLGAWAAIHQCGLEPLPVQTKYSGGPKQLACEEFPDCRSGGRVVFCMYDGEHGNWPDQHRAASLVFGFFASVSGAVDPPKWEVLL